MGDTRLSPVKGTKYDGGTAVESQIHSGRSSRE